MPKTSLIALCGLVVLMGAGCSSSSTLEQQAACAKQAKQMESEDNKKLSEDPSYDREEFVSAHYHKKLDKCLILIEIDTDRSPTLGSKLSVHEELRDAFSEKVYASATWLPPKTGSFSLNAPPDFCNLNGRSCQTSKEFHDFVDSYMND